MTTISKTSISILIILTILTLTVAFFTTVNPFSAEAATEAQTYNKYEITIYNCYIGFEGYYPQSSWKIDENGKYYRNYRLITYDKDGEVLWIKDIVIFKNEVIPWRNVPLREPEPTTWDYYDNLGDNVSLTKIKISETIKITFYTKKTLTSYEKIEIISLDEINAPIGSPTGGVQFQDLGQESTSVKVYYNYILSITTMYLPSDRARSNNEYYYALNTDAVHGYMLQLYDGLRTTELAYKRLYFRFTIDGYQGLNAYDWVAYGTDGEMLEDIPRDTRTVQHSSYELNGSTHYAMKVTKSPVDQGGTGTPVGQPINIYFSTTQQISDFSLRISDVTDPRESELWSDSDTLPFSYTVEEATSNEPLYYINPKYNAYNDGYSDGYGQVSEDAFAEGYEQGYDAGIAIGSGDYQSGYGDGYDQGYNEGYSKGSFDTNVSLSAVTGNALGSIGSFVMDILNIEIAGISLWKILAVLGGILLIGIIIKLGVSFL